jgi:hypothetical protein
MLRAKPEPDSVFVGFNGTVFRTKAAAARDAASLGRYLRAVRSVRAITKDWLSARYVPTPAARRCVAAS